ncbi:neurochondrin-like [Saccostrea echinata]|uniref:neurochondrin-like n=1 Tax=Saccostrea echinata TaxID=191078 RepID=UPI002A800895|nr:neurochondrin-like [Saccostrea echinata]
MENKNLEKCIVKLQEATSDNEKFAAMLMVAKTTRCSDMSKEEKKRIFNAIGLPFLIRLLKSDSQPEECSANIYKCMALTVLSGLCADTDLVQSAPLYRVLKPLNEVILIRSNNDEEVDNMINDAFEILKMFAGSQQGIQHLLDNGTISALTKVIAKELYGAKKAFDLLTYILHTMKPCVWTGQEQALGRLLNYFAKKMAENQDQEKFELCNFIGMILRVTPISEFRKAEQQQWHKSILKGIQDIFSNRLGEAQREPALKLVASLIDRVGMEFVLPPNMKDNKVLLMIIHLSCIEVRMALENFPIDKISEKADLLCACYHLLENIIIYLTTSPSLLLDEKQILQLHSAMLGAFHSIIFFLKELSDENNAKGQYQNPVVIATVRVLGAWLAEETSALRSKTYEILPFLLHLCKLQMEFSHILSSEQGGMDANPKGFIDDTGFENIKKKVNIDTQAISDALSECLTMEDEEDENVEDEQGEKDDGQNELDEGGDGHLEGKQEVERGKREGNKCAKSKSVHVTQKHGELKEEVEDNKEQSANSKENCEAISCDGNSQTNHEDSSASPRNDPIDDTLEETSENVPNGAVDSDPDEDEASYLGDQSSMSVDLLRFLLPGLCHLTSEDEPRQILVDNELLPMLNHYLKHMLKRYFKDDTNDNVVKALELLCNIFLNFAVIEPNLVRRSGHLVNVTLIVMEAVPLVGRKTEFNPLWLKMVTLGMFYLRHQSCAVRSVAAEDVLVHFFICACTFVKGAFINSSKNRKKDVLTVSPNYLPFWEEASQLWFLTIQAMTTCTAMYPQLVKAVLISGMMPQLAKVFIAVQGRDVGDEVIRCVLALFITMAHCHEKVRNVIKTTGGLQLSKIYDSKELRMELGIAEKSGNEKKS